MKPSRAALLLAGAGLAVLAGLYILLMPRPAPTARTSESAGVEYEFRVEKGARVSGTPVITAREGDLVTLKVTSDRADELHVHGYDVHAEVQPGSVTTLAFRADRAGRFDVELHRSDLALATLEVTPK